MLIDDWRPSMITRKILPSSWRQEYNANYKVCTPDHDDVRKIKFYLKRGASDAQVIELFNIKPDVLECIKDGTYNFYKEKFKLKDSHPLSGNKKLNEDDVYGIKRLIQQGKNNVEIGLIYRVTRKCISFIRTGRAWAHIQIEE